MPNDSSFWHLWQVMSHFVHIDHTFFGRPQAGQEKRLSLLPHGCSRWIRCSLWEGWETFLPWEQLNMFSHRAAGSRQPIRFPQPHTLHLHRVQRGERSVWSVLQAKMTLKIACLRARLDREKDSFAKTYEWSLQVFFYSTAPNTSDFLYLLYLFYVSIRPSIRGSEPVWEFLYAHLWKRCRQF